MKTQHTATPWYATNVDSEYVIQSAKINEDNYVGKTDYPEDAEFIVKCVNNHNALVEALKLAENCLLNEHIEGNELDIIQQALQQAGE